MSYCGARQQHDHLQTVLPGHLKKRNARRGGKVSFRFDLNSNFHEMEEGRGRIIRLFAAVAPNTITNTNFCLLIVAGVEKHNRGWNNQIRGESDGQTFRPSGICQSAGRWIYGGGGTARVAPGRSILIS